MFYRERRHRRFARRRNDGPEKVSKRKHVKFRSDPFRSVRGRGAENAHARSPFFLFKSDRPRKLPSDVPSRPLRLHRFHCYTFSDVIRTSELSSGSDADVTLVNTISERPEQRKRKREGEWKKEWKIAWKVRPSHTRVNPFEDRRFSGDLRLFGISVYLN